MAQPGFFSPRERGFTLIEIAIVIVILALLLAMLLGISASMIAQQRRDSTKAKLANVETALALFVSQNQRLPCPADGSLDSANASAGLEQSNNGGVLNQCNLGGTANSQTNGVVPWRSLGLSEADATDGWGTRFTYRVAPEFVRNSSMNMVGCDPGGTGPVSGANPTPGSGYCLTTCTTPFSPAQCTLPSSVTAGRGLRVKNLNATFTLIMNPAASPSTGAAYVLISHGENRAGGYDATGTLQGATGPAAGTEEQKNFANASFTNGTTDYVDDFPVFAETTGHFDDFVVRPTILGVATKAQLGPRAH